MYKYTVIFTNNYGKSAFIITAQDETDAIRKAINMDLIEWFQKVEAVAIIEHKQ